MAHDQLFKELIRAFFREFLELFYPDVASRLDYSRVTFLDREVFTDVPEGKSREPDVVVEAYTLDGNPEVFAFHIEVQRRRESEVAHRMWEYYSLLRLRLKLPVFPVIVYLKPGAGGLTREVYNEGLFGRETVRFEYDVVGLPDLAADEYVENPNPLAPALASLMSAGDADRVGRKFKSLSRILTSGTDEARKSLLAYTVDHYLKLSPTEDRELQELMDRPTLLEGEEMIDVKELYRADAKREMLLEMLEAKFGSVPEWVSESLDDIDDPNELRTLVRRVLTATSIEDVGLNPPAEQ